VKLQARYIVIGLSVLALCLISFLLVKVVINNPEKINSHITPSSEADSVKISFNETVANATHVIDAEYVGDYTSEYGSEHMFKPIKVLKGEVDIDVNSVIYVQPLSDHSEEETVPYKKNEQYMLFLEKNISVYYEHDKYVQIGELHLSSNDSKWEKYHVQLQTALVELDNSAPSNYGVDYTNSKEIKDILEVSQNIFVVKIEDIYAKSTVTPTTVYRSSVTKTIRNTPVEDGNILITLFNDTVDIGGEYVILLADATDTAPVYTLASKNYSVYSFDEAEKIPALKKLLNEATTFTTIQNTKTDRDILTEEIRSK